MTIKKVDADGQTIIVEHPVNYDGQEHPLSEPSHAHKILGTNRRTLSQDGKTMTITCPGTGLRGGAVKNTAF